MREEGFYWVRFGLPHVGWTVACYSGDIWFLVNYEHEFHDSDFDEIDERKIVQFKSEKVN